jgi:hypothetical protein
VKELAMNFAFPVRTFRSTVLRFLRAFALYLVIVIGGLTLFLIVIPLVGYVLYGDRPGPGWYGVMPTFSWHGIQETLGFSQVFARLFAFPTAIITALVLLFERICDNQAVTRIIGGVLGAIAAAFVMYVMAWIMSPGSVLLLVALCLGAIAGGTALPQSVR